MARVITCARLSDAVYSNDPRLDKWTRIAFKKAGNGLRDAFQGAAFRRGTEVLVAFKGTSGVADGIADIKLGVGMNTSHYADAAEFLASVPVAGRSVVLCGHSLGGAIAQIIGNRHRLPFVTFNAPGVGLLSRNVGEVAVSMGLGTAAVRTAGAVASAFRHPVQAAQDLGSVFHRVRGVNFRLGKDVVGCIGVHYGRVIEITYSGGTLDVAAKHRMTTVLAALEKSSHRNVRVDTLM